MENNWVSYKNGNYTVRINLDNGTKIRENNLDFFDASTVESMDIKITNCCSGGRIVNGKIVPCEFCHEKSVPNGKRGDIMNIPFIDKLHPYTELAIGGGNPLEHPDLIPFLEKCKALKLIPSMTVNQIHFMRDYDLIKELVDNKLIYGLGISLVNPKENGFIDRVKTIPNAVIHVINGIVTMPELDRLSMNGLKILILGYKTFGRGVNYYESESEEVEALKKDLYTYLPEIIERGWFKVVSFDNLALEQLNPKRFMTEEEWNRFYMGEDGVATMYVDCVERKFALNSCSEERFDLLDNIEDMFKVIKR